MVMKQRHKEEIKELLEKLKSKHKAEEVTEKEKYQALTIEKKGHMERLTKKRELVLQRKDAEEQDTKHQRDTVSHEDLLAFIEKTVDEKYMRKRRKTEGIPSL